MAIVDVVVDSQIGAMYVSDEGVAFGTAGTERRMHPITGTAKMTFTQTEIETPRLRTRTWDVSNTVRGQKSATAQFEHYLQPATTVLVQGATPDTDANAPLRVLLRCLLGGESVAAGSVIASSPSPGAGGATVASSEGDRFPEGQIVLLEDPTNGLVPARILTRATDALTWWPNLSGAQSADDLIVNSYTWYPTRTNSKSLSLAIANGQDANVQRRAVGGTGTFKLTFPRNDCAKISFELAFASWSGPSALSLAITHSADPMFAPVACRAPVLLLQPIATTTRTNVPIESIEYTLNFGNRHSETLTGGTEGMRGVFRSENVTQAFCEIDLVTPYDSTWETRWSAQTDLSGLFYVPVDTDTGRRVVGVDTPLVVMVNKPEIVDGSDGLAKHKIKLRAKLDTSTTGTLDNEQLAQAPFRLFAA
jgi:hypothetical protein